MLLLETWRRKYDAPPSTQWMTKMEGSQMICWRAGLSSRGTRSCWRNGPTGTSLNKGKCKLHCWCWANPLHQIWWVVSWVQVNRVPWQQRWVTPSWALLQGANQLDGGNGLFPLLSTAYTASSYTVSGVGPFNIADTSTNVWCLGEFIRGS